MGRSYPAYGNRHKPTQGRKWFIAAAVIVLIAGICMIYYPHVEEMIYENEIADLKSEFLHDAEDPPQSLYDYDLLYKYLKAENKRLYETGQNNLTDAFSYEQPAVDLSDYGIKDNCIGFISLPSIEMELPVYLGANEDNMMKGAVHLTQTSYPIGGVNTNSVIAAHRGTTKVMFRNIHNMQIGDPVIITNFRERLKYRVTEIKIILPNEIRELLIRDGRDMITLISCNPLGENYQRYVVYCERNSG